METRKLSFLDEMLYWGRTGKQSTVLAMRIGLTQEVDPQVLESALASALQVHTNFRIRPVIEDGRITAIVDDVKNPPLFKDDGRPKHLGTDEMDGMLLYATYEERAITLHVFHGIADLLGIAAFTKTLLGFYFNALGLASIDLPEPDSMDTAPIYEAILAQGAPGAPSGIFIAGEHDIFHLPVETYGTDTTRQRMLEIHVPLEPVLALAKESKSSVVPTLEAIVGHAIRQAYEVGEKEVVAYTPANLRQIFGVATGGNGSAAFPVPYPAEYDGYDIHERARRLRDDMKVQMQPANAYATIAATMENLKPAQSYPAPIEMIAPKVVAAGRDKDRKNYTYGLSYGGKISFGEQIDPFIASIVGYTGSYSYPLWIVANELNGVIQLVLLQNYESDELARAIFQELSGHFPQTAYVDMGYVDIDELHLSELRHI